MEKLSLRKRTGSDTKNGAVELLRFLFTSVIIFFHINLDLWDQQKVVAVVRGIPVTFFKHGNIAVEFFFLVTGWLMARSVWKKILAEEESRLGKGSRAAKGNRTHRGNRIVKGSRMEEGNLRAADLAEETRQFAAHKARAILPFYLTACALTPLARLATDRSLTLEYFALRMPSLLFLQRAGLGKPFIGCTWYLSSMLLALVLAYPLCRRFYRVYTCFAGPVSGFILLGAIIVLTGSLGDIEDWFFITYKTNVRAFAEISVGAWSFEISRRISGWFARRDHDLRDCERRDHDLRDCERRDCERRDREQRAHDRSRRTIMFCRWLLTLTAVTCLSLSAAYMCSTLDSRLALVIFCLLTAAVTIVFSGQGALCQAGVFDHPVFAYLGRISLPMYVSQTLFRMCVPYWFSRSTQWTQCLMIYTGILIFAAVMEGTAQIMKKHRIRIPVRTGAASHTN